VSKMSFLSKIKRPQTKLTTSISQTLITTQSETTLSSPSSASATFNSTTPSQNDDDPILKNLNPQQLQAVTCDNNQSTLVLSGAGSGKTRVLTTRIAYLIREHSVKSDEILAVTFTNKAALEMRGQITKMLINMGHIRLSDMCLVLDNEK
ncbi:unnamed protein product, partial [Didymodactylos carnosus]